MNGDQLNTGGGDLNQTQNPQTIPSQDFGASQNNLQTSNSTLLSQGGLKISGVGLTNAQAIAPKTATVAQTADSTPTTSSSILPLEIAFFVGIAILLMVAFLAIKEGQKQAKTGSAKAKSKS